MNGSVIVIRRIPQNTSSELNQTQDSFINSLYDEDLQLMDINGVNDSEYTHHTAFRSDGRHLSSFCAVVALESVLRCVQCSDVGWSFQVIGEFWVRTAF